MGTRYSNIRNATELKTGLDNYTAYLSDPARRQTKRLTGSGTPGTRSKLVEMGVKPFGYDIPDGEVGLQIRGSQPAYDKLNTQLGDRVVLITSGNADDYNRIAGFTPAKITLFEPSGGGRSYEQAKATQLYYIKYPGKSYTCPFGASGTGAAAEAAEYQTDIETIEATVRTAYTADYTRVSFKEESFDAV